MSYGPDLTIECLPYTRNVAKLKFQIELVSVKSYNISVLYALRVTLASHWQFEIRCLYLPFYRILSMHMGIAGPKYGDFMLLWKTLLGSFTTPFYIWQWAVLICKLGKILF